MLTALQTPLFCLGAKSCVRFVSIYISEFCLESLTSHTVNFLNNGKMKENPLRKNKLSETRSSPRGRQITGALPTFVAGERTYSNPFKIHLP